jgi:transglutaminase-like putative cysteine protease
MMTESWPMNSELASNYLRSSHIIDWDNPQVLKKAVSLAGDKTSDVEIAKQCFEFVRDEIYHSKDYEMNPITLRASDVLKFKTGFCFAKSHLLAALLRANGIPAGLCYQRVVLEGPGNRFYLHGLNAIYLKDYGWYRADARGNSKRVQADFAPPKEALAYHAQQKGEANLMVIWEEPLPMVIELLSNHTDYKAVLRDLPDIEILNHQIPFGD